MNLNPQSFDIISSIRSSCKIGKIKLNLIPSLVQSHWHCANEWLHSCCWLVIGRPKSSSHIFVVKDHDFESEIFSKLRKYEWDYIHDVMMYFLTFLMIMTRKGNLIPKVFFGSAGHWMNVVLTFVPIISRTDDWMSGSVILLICPFRTFLSHIWSGLLLSKQVNV